MPGVLGPLSPLGLVADDPRLFGKIVADDGPDVIVEFFHSVAVRERIRLPRDSWAHTVLQKQTRVFHNANGKSWRVGRVVDAFRQPNGLFEYEVRFPNRVDKVLSETEIYVRAISEFGDPAANLAAGCAETQFFADRRRRALERLLQMRAAAEGLTGLVSASVDLVPHQLAVIRRILQDPIQRYLLADEVGLGKTIEAGVIIRQTLIDDPTRSVLVLAPEIMIDQWNNELVNKLHADDFGSAAVEVNSYGTVLDLDEVPDLLVVDEAHQVVALNAAEQLNVEKAAVARLVARTPRVLLLSATPPVGEEDRLFGLLHLLDPTLYPESKRSGFKDYVSNRGRIGRLLVALQSGGGSLPLRRAASQARKLFESDPETVRLADAVLTAENDPVTLEQTAGLLRDHIAETHRIHRRLLRSRRIDAERTSMRRRGPAVHADQDPDLSHIRLDWPDSVASRELCEALDNWHSASRTYVRANPDQHEVLADRCLHLYEALASGPRSLSILVGNLSPIFPEEEDLLDAMARRIAEGDPTDRYDAMVRSLREWRQSIAPSNSGLPPKIISFASDPNEADVVAQRLQKVFGPGAIRRLQSDDQAAQVIEDFAANKEEWVLVCDRTGEEGLNLQFANGVLHVDLPFDPTRLEQRIGRLDRYGRKLKVITHRVLLPFGEDDTVWRSWFDLLANGFLVFNQSISDVQFRLDELSKRIKYTLLDEGAFGLITLVGEIRNTLAEERQRLDEQYVFESAVGTDETPEQIVMRMEDEEADEASLAADLYPWMTKVIGLDAYSGHGRGAKTVKWRESSDTLVPKHPWLGRLAAGLDRPTTWWRQEAVRHPDQVLLRPGAPLIDRLEEFSKWDDRGTAFATWRTSADFPEPWCGFQLTWLVEPGATSSTDILRDSDENGSIRRAMALYPPWITTQFLDEDMRTIESNSILEILKRPYGDEDQNIGSQFQVLDSVIDSVRFTELCKSARGIGEALLRESAEYKQRLDVASRALQRELMPQQRHLHRRLALADANIKDGLTAELAILDRIDRAVRQPTLRLDSIGFFVISNRGPQVAVR